MPKDALCRTVALATRTPFCFFAFVVFTFVDFVFVVFTSVGTTF